MKHANIDTEIGNCISPDSSIIKQITYDNMPVRHLSADEAACISESNRRSIISTAYRGGNDLIMCPGTQGLDFQEFLKINFSKLLCFLANIILCDRFERTIRLFNKECMNSTLVKAYTSSVQLHPYSLWNRVRSHLILTEARHWLLHSADQFRRST